MKKLFALAFLLMGAGLLFSTSAPAHQAMGSQAIDRIIVFGDSYSDNGNDFRISQGKYPNAVRYFQGRFSDGPVWVEYLAKNFDLDTHDAHQFLDYAYGQAKILSPTSIKVTGNPNKDYPIPDLSQQVDDFVTQHQQFSANDLVVVYMSTNDFFDVTDLTNTSFFETMADQEALQIQRLIQLGAKHLIVLNGRDVTYSPLAEIYVCKDPHTSSTCLRQFRNLIQVYNQRLSADLKDIKEVFLFDIYKFDTGLITHIQLGGYPYPYHGHEYVLKNSTTGCYDNNKGDYQGVAGGVCNNPKQHFFYDRIHTTKNVGYLLAKNVYEEYIQART